MAGEESDTRSIDTEGHSNMDTVAYKTARGSFTSSPLSQPSSGSERGSHLSGSDYSQPVTPNASRPTSMHPQNVALSGESTFEDVALNSRPNSYIAKAALIRASNYGDQNAKSAALGTPPRSQSPDGSDYSGSPSHKSPDTPTVPVSAFDPHDARMSINSLSSFDLADVDYEYSPAHSFGQEQRATPKGKSHSRNASTTEAIDTVWSSSWSRARRPTLTRPSPPTRQSTLFDVSKDLPLTPTTPTNESELVDRKQELGDAVYNTTEDSNARETESEGPTLNVMDTSSIWRTERYSSLGAPTRVSTWPEFEDIELDWSTLDKNEEQEKEDKDIPEGAEDESTRFLLARLEQENAKFTADPKSSATKRTGRLRSQTRPPSMAHLKKLVAQDAPSIRYSLVHDAERPVPEEPPPMTELEFWAALVQDYPSTASRLPTLTATKIRAGIPPPLRGVVWTSMSGARDKDLEEAFETLQNEESPYEGIINKDVGRSFPGVELFRDADGEGQKMLGRVLKCFSLHDKDIGYCQGLGFLVGPLLMNMGEKEAFCVLVRLMDHYALRPSFLPSLSGLHMRIFQFSTLLKQHMPELSEHLGRLGVEPAYLSQWFLSCFAVTCPLPMLFRIYDVIFAEGANETVMRVALALFRRNEEKMMASNEFEDVMQLLLGRSLWDVYAYSADDLVDDFTSLGDIITYARLAELEKEFESKDGEAVGQSAGFLPDVQAAASRFLGRLWAPSHGATPSKGAISSLSPNSAEKDGSPYGYLARPSTFLRRSPSKNSIGAINDSNSSESSGSASGTSTVPTEAELHDGVARESQADSRSMRSKSESMFTVSGSTSAHAQHSVGSSELKEQELQSEIEDLLMALSEMQREHAQMAAMLQREREERTDDQRVVKKLINKLSNTEEDRKSTARRSMPPLPRIDTGQAKTTPLADKRRTLPPGALTAPKARPDSIKSGIVVEKHQEEIKDLVDLVQSRLDVSTRFSASFETRAQLRSALARTREQLSTAETQVKDWSARAEISEISLANYQAEAESLRSEVEELRTRVNDDFKEKKKLELKIENLTIQMRMEAKAVERKQRSAELARLEKPAEVPSEKKSESPNRSRTGSLSSAAGSAGGLRELKLCRPDSASSVASIRSMRSQRFTGDEWPRPNPPSVDLSASPPRSREPETTPVAAPTTPISFPSLPQTPSLAVPAPSGPYFSRRTTSLAAQEVFATPQHEPVPEDALLLELVNAKTAEATARQEVDEMKRSMQIQKRRADESLLELQAAVASAKLEAEKAREEAEKARQEAKTARAEVFDASELNTPVTPAVSYSFYHSSAGRNEKSQTPPIVVSPSPSPVERSESKESDAAAAGFGNWFWNRRTAS